MPSSPVPLQLQPITMKAANAFIRTYHRHAPHVRGCIACLSLVDANGTLRAVAVIGRPVSRVLDDGTTAEVTRLCTDLRTPHACSRLYNASWRAARALGYRRLITYTRADELGTSVTAAGWQKVADVNGQRQWATLRRPRTEREEIHRHRWERSTNHVAAATSSCNTNSMQERTK